MTVSPGGGDRAVRRKPEIEGGQIARRDGCTSCGPAGNCVPRIERVLSGRLLAFLNGWRRSGGVERQEGQLSDI